MKSFEVNQNKNLIDSRVQKEFRFKIHHQTGPGFHTEFKFSIRSKPSNNKNKKIEFSANKNIKLAFSENGNKNSRDSRARI